MGDLSENAEYQFAKEKQSFVEGPILDIDDKLARAEVIDNAKIVSDKIVFDDTVTVHHDEGRQKRYQIVGEPETNLESGKLSVSSPLARA